CMRCIYCLLIYRIFLSCIVLFFFFFFFFNDTATTEIYTLSLHDALPIFAAHLAGRQIAQAHAEAGRRVARNRAAEADLEIVRMRSEEHTSELQSRENLVCRLLLEKKKKKTRKHIQQQNKTRARENEMKCI